MIITVTGSRFGITEPQLQWLWRQFEELDITCVHHGGCVGADQSGHAVALKYNLPIIVHPPSITTWMMAPDWNHPKVTVLPHKPYHERDRDMVDVSAFVLGMPNGEHPPQGKPPGGTWYTLDYAQHRRTGRRICLPDGKELP